MRASPRSAWPAERGRRGAGLAAPSKGDENGTNDRVSRYRLDLKTLKTQADEIAKKFKTAEAKAAWEGPWKEHHEAFKRFAEAKGVKLVEREFDTPTEGATPYSYNSCYHWFVTGRKDDEGRIEICDLRRSRKRLDGTLKCVYDCGFFTPT